jgi:preprotein translocase subunit SecB
MQKSNFQLKSQRLISVAFELNPNFKRSGEIELDVDILSEVVDQREKFAIVRLKLAAFKKTEQDTAPFKSNIVVEGVFTWSDPIEESELQSFLNINAPAVLMSFIRPVLSQLTVFSGLPGLILPMFNFTKPA